MYGLARMAPLKGTVHGMCSLLLTVDAPQLKERKCALRWGEEGREGEKADEFETNMSFSIPNCRRQAIFNNDPAQSFIYQFHT
jgi:hypothetical protein